MGQSQCISLSSMGGSITQSHPCPPFVSLHISSSNEQVHSWKRMDFSKILGITPLLSTCLPLHPVGQTILLALNVKYTQEKKATSMALIRVSLPVPLLGYVAPAASLVPLPCLCLLWSVHGQAAIQKSGHSSTRILQWFWWLADWWPLNIHGLMHVTSLGERDPADVIKRMGLHRGGTPATPVGSTLIPRVPLLGWGQRGGGVGLEVCSDEFQVRRTWTPAAGFEGEEGFMSQGMTQPLEARKGGGEGFSPAVPRKEPSLADTLISAQWDPCLAIVLQDCKTKRLKWLKPRSCVVIEAMGSWIDLNGRDLLLPSFWLHFLVNWTDPP